MSRFRIFQQTLCFTDPPGAPGDITVQEVGGDFVSLKWDRPTNDGGGRIIGYYIEKKEASGTNWSRVNPVRFVCHHEVASRIFKWDLIQKTLY